MINCTILDCIDIDPFLRRRQQNIQGSDEKRKGKGETSIEWGGGWHR